MTTHKVSFYKLEKDSKITREIVDIFAGIAEEKISGYLEKKETEFEIFPLYRLKEEGEILYFGIYKKMREYRKTFVSDVKNTVESYVYPKDKKYTDYCHFLYDGKRDIIMWEEATSTPSIGSFLALLRENANLKEGRNSLTYDFVWNKKNQDAYKGNRYKVKRLKFKIAINENPSNFEEENDAKDLLISANKLKHSINSDNIVMDIKAPEKGILNSSLVDYTKGLIEISRYGIVDLSNINVYLDDSEVRSIDLIKDRYVSYIEVSPEIGVMQDYFVSMLQKAIMEEII